MFLDKIVLRFAEDDNIIMIREIPIICYSILIKYCVIPILEVEIFLNQQSKVFFNL